MEIAAPRSWANAHLDDAGELDRAPILAIQAAIAERLAVQNGALFTNPRNVFADPAGAPNARTFAADALRSILELRKGFFNPAPDYANFGWTSLERLDSGRLRGSSGGVGPYDLIARLPIAPQPAPADSTASAVTRAFYAWCRAALDAMTVVQSTRWRVAGHWEAGGTIWETLEEMLAAATYTENPGGGLSEALAWSAGGEYDAVQKNWWNGIYAPDGISVCNPTNIEADARLVVRAETWPGGEWSDDRITCSTVFGGFGLASAPGPSESTVRVGPGEWGELVPSGSCPSPGASPPAWPGAIDWTPPAGGGMAPLQTWSIGCEVSALLDYTPGFRFKADAPEEQTP